jgi:hypothetical protein
MRQIIYGDGKFDSAAAYSLFEKAEDSLNLPVRHCSVAPHWNKHALSSVTCRKSGWLQPMGLFYLSLHDFGYLPNSRTHRTMSAAASETPQDAMTEEGISGPAAMQALSKRTKRNACIFSFPLFCLY